ncbi:MAG TPA: DUF1552 domain-containing protein [Polyangiaceae bacterium]|nr:DUF1552 domain-containing protein [Polyangiaceae bacterium]
MKKLVLSRRKVLRGAAFGVGAAVGLPLLEAMLNPHGDALAQGEPLPKRFGAFFWGNGVVANLWIPTETGAAWQLSPLLAPLANVKDYVSIVSGTVVYIPYQVSGHMGSLQAITSGALGTPQGGLNYAYANQTFDQAIAAKIGTTTRFSSLHLGVASTDASDADFGAVAKSISHNGPNSPNLPEYDPIALYDRVFGDGFSTGTSTDVASVTIATRKSVLDLVADDTRALEARLGTIDKQRLDQHLQGILDLEKQLQGMPATAPGCGLPTRPESSYPAIDAEQIQWESLTSAQTDLLVFALACDQTRVFTYRFSPCNDFTVYPGFPTFVIDPTTTNTGTSMHGMTHTESGDQPGVQQCVTFSMTKFAALLERLLATPEGAGSLLDNCAILGFTECTEGRSHNAAGQPGIPMIVAGRAGGSLVHPGIHYKSPLQGDSPSETNGRNVSVVPLTLMQAMDTGITSWGQDAGLATQVISELLT